MDNGQGSFSNKGGSFSNKMLVIGVVVVVVIVAGIVLLMRGTQTTPEGGYTTPPQKTPEVSEEDQTEEATSDAMMEEGSVKTFEVSGSPFKFAPAQIKVKKGDSVKITFKNAQGVHDFVILEFDVKTKQLSAGQSETVEFIADTAGEYKYYCSVGNHRAQGMEGTLIVE